MPNFAITQPEVKLAIDIVEHFKTNLDIINNKSDGNKKNDEYIIESSILENITNDYVNFKTQKLFILKVIKDCGEKMAASLNELKLPNLDAYLTTQFSFSTNQNDKICKYCNKEVPKSLVQHYRYCKSKLEMDIDSEQNETLNTNENTIISSSSNEQLNISIDEKIINNVKQKNIKEKTHNNK